MQQNMKYLGMLRRLFIVATILFAQSAWAKMSTLEFQDAAAEVLMNVLKTQPKKSFLKKVYTRLLFVPVWVDESGLTPYTKELLGQIKSDPTLDKHGKIYRKALSLEKEAKSIGNSFTKKLSLEIELTDLYKKYANYTVYGSINWGAFLARLWNIKTKDIHADWVTHKPKTDPVAMLEDAVLGGSLKRVFEKVIPTRYRYRRLQQALADYIRIQEQGGWQQVHFKGILKPGKHYPVIPAIRERLKVTKDYIPCSKNEAQESTLYDQCLKRAVVRFQARNGLDASGIMGKNTKRAMNISVAERIMTLRLNLDRLKWLRDPPPGRHVWINIPAFMLYFEEDGNLLQTIKVIVGKPDHPTPIFSDTVEAVVLNPYWNIPKSIIQKEMIPKLLRNPYALKKKGIEIFSGWGANAERINPASVDWSKYRYSKNVPFRFAQLPGRRNALGKIKFLFPNQFSVYMHDTPNKKLFKRNVRAFSHGCIRLSQPRELLRTFSTFEPGVDFGKSQKILKGKEKTYIQLHEKVPVDITYLTAWIDHKGKLQFRNDIYHYDKMQLQAYRKW